LESTRNALGEDVYFAKSAKLVSLKDLICDIKLEFQSNNKRMYSEMAAIFEIKDD
jgi:hypothetical protein